VEWRHGKKTPRSLRSFGGKTPTRTDIISEDRQRPIFGNKTCRRYSPRCSDAGDKRLEAIEERQSFAAILFKFGAENKRQNWWHKFCAKSLVGCAPSKKKNMFCIVMNVCYNHSYLNTKESGILLDTMGNVFIHHEKWSLVLFQKSLVYIIFDILVSFH